MINLALLLIGSLWAGPVEKVNGQSLIFLNDENLSVGQRAYVYNSSGKKVGLIEVKKVAKTKALGKIIKGVAEPGMQVSAQLAKPNPINRNRWGLTVGYSQSSLSTPQERLQGNSTTFGAFVTFDLGSSLFIQIGGQYVPFQVRNGSNFGDFKYLDLNGRLGYFFGNFHMSVGGSFLFTLSSRYQIPQVTVASRVSNYFFMGLGYDLYLKNNPLHIGLDYNIFPSSANIQANMLILKLGYSWGI